MEFLRHIAADAATIGLDCPEFEAHAREYPGIRVVHGHVALVQACLVRVERIGILHQELARAHHAKARPDLVAELGLDLVEIHRQLLVAAQFLTRDVGNDFLVRRSIGEFAVMAVLEAQQLRTVLAPAGGFLPQLRRLDRRHAQFQGAGPVHLLADDALDLLQGAKSHRQPRVKPGCQAADHAGAQHQPVTDDLRVGGHLFERRNGVSG